MVSRRKQVLLLCEDKHHERLTRSVLEKRFKIGLRQIEVRVAQRSRERVEVGAQAVRSRCEEASSPPEQEASESPTGCRD